mmetsp:Transcript_18479/g.42782  ORF Transcript_18479/g.42782 Transcript_18479/m.42782 type:complete len:204 (+) Transcript_18479:262-873(+)
MTMPPVSLRATPVHHKMFSWPQTALLHHHRTARPPTPMSNIRTIRQKKNALWRIIQTRIFWMKCVSMAWTFPKPTTTSVTAPSFRGMMACPRTIWCPWVLRPRTTTTTNIPWENVVPKKSFTCYVLLVKPHFPETIYGLWVPSTDLRHYCFSLVGKMLLIAKEPGGPRQRSIVLAPAWGASLWRPRELLGNQSTQFLSRKVAF